MKITQDEVVDSQTTLHIELEDPDLAPYLDQGYRQISSRINIPGFRKGKAPRRIVESYIGRESLLSEVLDNMVYETTDKAIQEQELDAVGLPKIDDLDLDPVQFSATIPLRPDIDLGDYRSIRIDYEEAEVTEDEVTDRINGIRESMGTWEDVERAPEFGDLTTIDLNGTIDGEEVWNRPDTPFYLDEEGTAPVPGFSQSLVGVETDQEHQFTLEIPEDFRDASIAGKEASFAVTVKEVKERSLPELNDEFAQGLPDGYDDLEALQNAVEESLKTDADARVDREYEEKVIEALLEGATIEVAPVMLDHEVEHIQEDQDRFLQQANIRKEDYLTSIGKTEDEIREEAETEAVQRIKRTFALNKVADEEGVEVTDQEIDERFNQLYAGQPMRRQERRERRENVDRMLKYEKTLSQLTSIAKGEDPPVNSQTDSNDEDSDNPEEGEE